MPIGLDEGWDLRFQFVPSIGLPMRRWMVILCVIGLGAAAVAAFWPARAAGPRKSGPFPHELYVWQRQWTEGVESAVARSAPETAGFTVLAAEVSFPSGAPRVAHVQVDWSALKASGRPVGLALRIGPWAGSFEREGDVSRGLASLARSLVSNAREAGVEPVELQVDFDCAESRLDGYRSWVQSLREAVRPVPLAVTVLPCWMNRSGFAPLVRSADGFVLQVHSLARPAGPEAPIVLCDAAAARKWVEVAASAGVPFRVALPTYGYLVGFDSDGRYLGVSAEGPSVSWPAGATLRAARADAASLARLISDWRADRPAAMRGVVWYRMPVDGDRLNWSWPTLAAVMSGRIPKAALAVEVSQPQPGLAEVALVNRGDADATSFERVRVEWRQDRLLAADGLKGYAVDSFGTGWCLFARAGGNVSALSPGERRTIGWLRFDQQTEVRASVASIAP